MTINAQNQKPKDAQIAVRMPRRLRDEFEAAARANFRSAASVIREFMTLYVEDAKQRHPEL